MRARNIIISDIVLATGGTVRDVNNLNLLLEDWLLALGGVVPSLPAFGGFDGVVNCDSIITDCDTIIYCNI